MDNETLGIISSTNGDDAGYCHQLLLNFTEIYPVEDWKMKGFFSDSDLFDINCHWMGFEPFEPFVYFTLAIIYIVILIAGFFSNALVIYIIVWYLYILNYKTMEQLNNLTYFRNIIKTRHG